MNEIKVFKRNPAIHCWITHVLEGQYNENEKYFSTIFGKVKRIRIMGTIIDKEEKLINSNETDIGLEEDNNSNVRLDFSLDDSTGVVRGTVWKANPENYKEFNKGDIVDVIGRVSKYGDFTSIWIEIIRKVEEPNNLLLRDAEIIYKIKKGEIEEIPEFVDIDKDIEEISNEIDVDTLFEDVNASSNLDALKEKVFLIIEECSTKGDIISFDRLKKELKISDSKLRAYINDLIRESRIYESDNNYYEAF